MPLFVWQVLWSGRRSRSRMMPDHVWPAVCHVTSSPALTIPTCECLLHCVLVVKNISTVIRSWPWWPTCCTNPNQSFAVPTLRVSRYHSDRGVTGRLCFPRRRRSPLPVGHLVEDGDGLWTHSAVSAYGAVNPCLLLELELVEDLNMATESVMPTSNSVP